MKNAHFPLSGIPEGQGGKYKNEQYEKNNPFSDHDHDCCDRIRAVTVR